MDSGLLLNRQFTHRGPAADGFSSLRATHSAHSGFLFHASSIAGLQKMALCENLGKASFCGDFEIL
jgi:hypothetical protein